MNICSENTGQTIGIGVMSADAVHSHTSSDDKKITLSANDYIQLGQALIKTGMRPVYFTNGAPEDHSVLEQVKAQFPDPAQACFAERPITPEDLVHIIAGCSKIMAHRLHATIIATSLGIPIIGFQWDKKLQSFFDQIGKAEFCLENFDLNHIVAQLTAATASHIMWDLEPYEPLLTEE